MKKKLTAIFLAMMLSLSVLVGCGVHVDTSSTPEPTDSTMAELPPEDGTLPTECSGMQNLAYMAGVLSQKTNYRSVMTSTVTAKMIISYTQEVEAYRDYVDGVMLTEDISTSALVNTARQNCFVSGKVLSRTAASKPKDWNGKNTEWSRDEPVIRTNEQYIAEYGLLPMEFSAYILTEKTVLTSSEVTMNADGTFSQTYTFDPETSAYYYKRNMQQSGGLAEQPWFHSITYTYTFDSAWNVLKVVSDEHYGIQLNSMLGTDNCYAHSETNYFYDGSADIADFDNFFKQYQDKEATEIPPETPKEPTATDYLMEAFGAVLTDGAAFRLSADVLDMNLQADLFLRMAEGGLDLRLHTKNLALQLAGEKLFLAYDNLHAFCNINGLGLDFDMESLDMDALLEQLGGGTLVQTETGATLDMTLLLGETECDLHFLFDRTDGIRLVSVSVAVALGETEISAKMQPITATEQDFADITDTNTEITANVQTVLQLFAEPVCAEVSHETENLTVYGKLNLLFGETFSLCGDLTVSVGDMQAEACFAITEETVDLNLFIGEHSLGATVAVADITDLIALWTGNGQNESADILGAILTALSETDIRTLLGARAEDGAILFTVDTDVLLAALSIDLSFGEVEIALGEQVRLTTESLQLTVQNGTLELSERVADERLTEAEVAELLLAAERLQAITQDIFAVEVSATMDLNESATDVSAVLLFDTENETFGGTVNFGEYSLRLVWKNQTAYVNFEGLQIALSDQNGEITALWNQVTELFGNSATQPEVDTDSLVSVLFRLLTETELTVENTSIALTLPEIGMESFRLQNAAVLLRAAEDSELALLTVDESATDLTQTDALNLFGFIADGVHMAQNGVIPVEASLTLVSGETAVDLALEGNVYIADGVVSLYFAVTLAIEEMQVDIGFSYDGSDGRMELTVCNIAVEVYADELTDLATALQNAYRQLAENYNHIAGNVGRDLIPEELVLSLGAIADSEIDFAKLFSACSLQTGKDELTLTVLLSALTETAKSDLTITANRSKNGIFVTAQALETDGITVQNLSLHLGGSEKATEIIDTNITLTSYELKCLLDYLQAAVYSADTEAFAFTLGAQVYDYTEAYAEYDYLRYDLTLDAYLALYFREDHKTDYDLQLDIVLDGTNEADMDLNCSIVAKDGVSYLSISRFVESSENALKIKINNHDVLSLMATALSLLGVDTDLLNEYLGDGFFDSLQSGNIGKLDLSHLLDSLLGSAGNIDLSKLLSDLSVTDSELSISLCSDEIFGGSGLEDFTVAIEKENLNILSVGFDNLWLDADGSGKIDLRTSLLDGDFTIEAPADAASYMDMSSLNQLVQDFMNTAMHKDESGAYVANTAYYLTGKVHVSVLSVINMDVGLAITVCAEEDTVLNLTIDVPEILGMTAGKTRTDIAIRGNDVYMRRVQTSEWSLFTGFKDITPRYEFRMMTVNYFLTDILAELDFILNTGSKISDMANSSIANIQIDASQDFGAYLDAYAYADNRYSMTIDTQTLLGSAFSPTNLTVDRNANGTLTNVGADLSIISIVKMSATVANTGALDGFTAERYAAKTDAAKAVVDNVRTYLSSLDSSVYDRYQNGEIDHIF